MGQWKRTMNEPSGVPLADWVRTIPNDGLIRYLDIFNMETVIPTSTKALSEVLKLKVDEFTKSRAAAKALGDVIGTGLLFAEGEVHRVSDISGLRLLVGVWATGGRTRAVDSDCLSDCAKAHPRLQV